MATIGELSGDEREQQAAELKRKMQEAAKRTKGAAEKAEPAAAAAPPSPTPAVATAPATVAPAVATPVAKAETPDDEASPVATDGREEGAGVVVSEAHGPTNGNGAAAAAAPAATAVISAPPRPAAAPPAAAVASEDDAEQAAQRTMNRREFLMYSWGAALGLLTLQTGVASFLFLYPRFRVGEFGGKFFVPLSEVPPAGASPNGQNTAGKFWLVTAEDGSPRALYMVCVHLGCLYKWEESNHRFECPCHGSKYTLEGFYIEGPAARSLDTFATTVENGQLTVDTGRKIVGAPASESPFRASVV